MARPVSHASSRNASARPGPRRFVDWLVHPAVLLSMAAMVGLVIGFQFFQLNPRIVKLTVAGVVGFIFVRRSVYAGVGAFLIVYPFPSAIFIGNTNFIFAVLLMVIWVIKFSMGSEAPPRSTLLGGGIFLLLVAHLVSFVVLDPEVSLREAVENQQYLFAAAILYAVMANVVNTPRKLLAIFQVMTASAAVLYGIQLLEWTFPGLRIIPKWYLISPALGRAGATGRATGVFLSHYLLADMSAINVVLQLFLAARARGRWPKIYHGVVACMSVLIIFMAANRGALIILLVGLAILAWYLRRDLPARYVALVVPTVVLVFLIADQVTKERLGDVTLLMRMFGTRLDSYMPENRALIWEQYFGLIKESPILGHGPLINYERTGVWPHNGYLFYAYTTGLIGLGCFLWVLIKAIIKTGPGRAVSWTRGSFLQGASLVIHTGLIMWACGQLRTDHQRGNVAIYYAFSLLAIAAVIHYLRRREMAARRAASKRVDNPRRVVVS